MKFQAFSFKSSHTYGGGIAPYDEWVAYTVLPVIWNAWNDANAGQVIARGATREEALFNLTLSVRHRLKDYEAGETSEIEVVMFATTIHRQSTGSRELDELLSGGLPIGLLTVVERDPEDDDSDLLRPLVDPQEQARCLMYDSSVLASEYVTMARVLKTALIVEVPPGAVSKELAYSARIRLHVTHSGGKTQVKLVKDTCGAKQGQSATLS